MKIALSQFEIIPSMPTNNAARIINYIEEAKNNNADMIIFPEHAISGYLIGDMWESESFIRECEELGEEIIKASKDIFVVFGNIAVDRNKKNFDGRVRKYNALFLAKDGKLIKNPYSKIPYPFIIKTLLPNYKEFEDHSDWEGEDITPRIELVGDTPLTKRLYARQLCGQYNKQKFQAFKELLESTNDRLIVFYNYNEELKKLKNIVKQYKKPLSIVNGETKDLTAYENEDNSVTLIQYQAGSMGLNLQKANKIVYFTLTDKSELFEQSKKRIHRIGQNQNCFYYLMICKNSIEEAIYETLQKRKDFNDELFKQYEILEIERGGE